MAPINSIKISTDLSIYIYAPISLTINISGAQKEASSAIRSIILLDINIYSRISSEANHSTLTKNISSTIKWRNKSSIKLTLSSAQSFIMPSIIKRSRSNNLLIQVFKSLPK